MTKYRVPLDWIRDNFDAIEELMKGRAAVVPLDCPNAEGSKTTIVGIEYWTDAITGTPTLWARVDGVRLDKPAEAAGDNYWAKPVEGE